MKEIPLPEDFLNRAVNVDVIGAGGNGSQMLYGLAKIHFAMLAVGHPHGLQVNLYDPDSVTEANIGRQAFAPADVGHNKAIILIHRVNTYYGLNWEAVGARYKEDHRRPQLVIGCVDSAKSRREIAMCLKRNWNGWWLDLGNGERSGQIVLGKYARFIDDKVRTKDAQLERACRPPTVLELFPHLANPMVKEDNTPSCSLANALQRQDLFINQSVATFALHLLWTWFRHGKINHHGYFVNLEAGQVTPMRVDPEAWQRIRANSAPVKPKPKRRKAKPNNSRRRVSNENLPMLDAPPRFASGRAKGKPKKAPRSTLRHIEEPANKSRRRVKKKTPVAPKLRARGLKPSGLRKTRNA